MSKGVKVSSFPLTKKEIYSTTAVFGSQHFIVLNTLVGFTKILFCLLTEKQTGYARLLSVSKSLAEFAAFAANEIKSILRRGVYTTQNTI